MSCVLLVKVCQYLNAGLITDCRLKSLCQRRTSPTTHVDYKLYRPVVLMKCSLSNCNIVMIYSVRPDPVESGAFLIKLRIESTL